VPAIVLGRKSLARDSVVWKGGPPSERGACIAWAWWWWDVFCGIESLEVWRWIPGVDVAYV
jgi:hypothetical protein